MQNFNRRTFLKHAFFGSGLLGLRSVVSGLPPLAILNPHAFVASLTERDVERVISTGPNPQFLVLSASDAGEPLNCNVPGMYADSALKHPTASGMLPTTFSLGGTAVNAAGCWANFSSSTLGRLSFFHLATGNFQHGGLPDIQRLGDNVAGGEMLVSSLAKNLHPLLGTIQPQPITIGGSGTELITFGGVQQPGFSPTFIRDLLTSPAALANLKMTQSLRDRDLDALNAALKARSNPTQQGLIDAYATTQQQARQLPQSLLAQLSTITDDTVNSQAIAAALLCQLKLTPAVLVRFPFGGDNHTDNDPHNGPGALPAEGAQHLAAVSSINTLMSTLQSAGMIDAVTFATLTTFGRSNAPDLSGRSHNADHSCNIMIGANVRAGVVGGATLVGASPMALAIDPESGQGVSSGGIAANQTLLSYGATLTGALGLSTAVQKTIVPDGQAIASAYVAAT